MIDADEVDPIDVFFRSHVCVSARYDDLHSGFGIARDTVWSKLGLSNLSKDG
jgi:hypothetical protein